MKKSKKMCWAAILAVSLLAMWLLPLVLSMKSSAASVDYPAQLMNIAVKDNSKVLTENGTVDGSGLSVKTLGNNLSASWRFDRVGADSNGTYFKICNAESGRLLTPQGYKTTDGTSAIVYGSESAQSQHWYVVPVKNDRLGNALYYKIVNYSNKSLALTYSNTGVTITNYKGADSQLWLLNADGLQGFAGYCSDDNTGNIKAGDIGGLFGETVEVSTFDELKKYATSDTPYTIIVTKNIKVTNLNLNGTRYMCSAGRIYVHSNKTIIGSYGAHTLYNVQFCTATKNGVGNNIIIKNFEMQHDPNSNNNDSIVCYFGSGENIWVDHVTFTGHSAVNLPGTSSDKKDEDKFLACCYDADYCTVSDCYFGLHEYGLILGYPSDDANSYNNYNNFPRMSLISNRFKDTVTRGPGLMRWGYFHSLNNYVYNFSMAYTVHSGSKIFAENCNYDGASTKGNVICDWNEITYLGSYAESGSKFANCKRTTIEGSAQNCTWRPATNYSYVKLTADQAKSYCTSYSGSQSSKDNMMYLRFGKKGVPSAGYTELPNTPVAASFNDGACYRIKNVNSGLYMQVEGAAAKNNANIQQWGSDGTSVHDVWKLCSAGDGYYYIVSCVGDGGTYALDVAGKKTDNGTNIDLYQYNGETNQQFMLTRNSDGSYKIRTRISGEKSAVEVADASASAGANVQQYEVNGATCQDWILEAVSDPGCKMDTNLVYTFENAGSGLVMEIKDGLMKDSTNVHQWGSNNKDCQKWLLKAFGSGNYYYIRSLQDSNYVLKAEGSENGSNIDIVTYSSKDSAMLFRFTKNIDGTFSIVTHASKDACLVEVASASKDNGANVQQWQPTYNDCQKWNLKTETTTAATTATTTTTTKVTTTKAVTTTTKAETTTQTVVTTAVTTTTEPLKIPGDVNDDGEFKINDIILLQKWLIAVPDVKLDNWQAADLNFDNKLNVFDFCIMKRLYLKG